MTQLVLSTGEWSNLVDTDGIVHHTGTRTSTRYCSVVALALAIQYLVLWYQIGLSTVGMYTVRCKT
jgi:hypothetical protein